MLVKLNNDWFDPDGNLRSVLNNPHDVPDNWKDKLPSTAEVLKGKEAKEAKEALASAEEEEEVKE